MRTVYLKLAMGSLFYLGATSGVSGSSVDLELKNQATADLVVLRAEVVGEISNSDSSNIQMSSCKSRPDSEYAEWRDCTLALEKKYGLPSFHHVYINRLADISCKIVRVRTMARKIGLESSQGIGFSHGRQGRAQNVRFIEKSMLHKSGKRNNLIQGIDTLTHDFIGLSSCKIGAYEAVYEFRPFLAFSTPARTRYRSWDKFGPYRLESSSNGFDQTSQIHQLIGQGTSVGNTSTLSKKEVLTGRTSGGGVRRDGMRSDGIHSGSVRRNGIQNDGMRSDGTRNDSIRNDSIRDQEQRDDEILFEESGESYLLPD